MDQYEHLFEIKIRIIVTKKPLLKWNNLEWGILTDLFRVRTMSCYSFIFVYIWFIDDDDWLNFCDGCRSVIVTLERDISCTNLFSSAVCEYDSSRVIDGTTAVAVVLVWRGHHGFEAIVDGIPFVLLLVFSRNIGEPLVVWIDFVVLVWWT